MSKLLEKLHCIKVNLAKIITFCVQKSFLFSHHEVFMTFNPIILYKLNSEIFLALTANCDKNLIVRKHTDFLPQNGLIYTDFSLNILWTQNTALGTVMRGGAAVYSTEVKKSLNEVKN